MDNPLYIYAETAFHHEGDYDYLIKLINQAKHAGANGIKFQVIIGLDYLTSTKHTAYSTLQEYIFSRLEWERILNYTEKIGLDIVFMPLDIQSFRLLENIKAPAYIEIHPVCFYDDEIIREIQKTDIPIIVGVGGRTKIEIENIIKLLGNQLKVLMIGIQSFPSKLEDVKLKRISYYKNRYPKLLIGYADHSSYDDEFAVLSNDYALLLGATIFEKHLTIKEGEERVDYNSAINAKKLKIIVERLHFLNDRIVNLKETQLVKLDQSELVYRNRQKVFVANSTLSIGHIISKHDIVMKMINKENGLTQLKDLVGKRIIDEIQKDDIITKQQLK